MKMEIFQLEKKEHFSSVFFPYFISDKSQSKLDWLIYRIRIIKFWEISNTFDWNIVLFCIHSFNVMNVYNSLYGYNHQKKHFSRKQKTHVKSCFFKYFVFQCCFSWLDGQIVIEKIRFFSNQKENYHQQSRL